MASMRRREFLGTVAGAAVASGARARDGSAARPDLPAAPSFDRAMRWGQLAFVENDPGRYDPQFWLDYFARTHCDAVTLSAGGVVAFYPTKVPFHRRSAWMKEGMDTFGELARACRQRGHAGPGARGPSRGVRRRARAPIRNGSPSTRRDSPDDIGRTRSMWVTCAPGPAELRQHDRGRPRDRHASTTCRGSSPTAGPASGTCYCETCRRNFKAATGKELPGAGPDDPARRDYILWRPAAAARALGGVGRGDPHGPPRRALHPQRAARPGERRPARTSWPWTTRRGAA